MDIISGLKGRSFMHRKIATIHSEKTGRAGESDMAAFFDEKLGIIQCQFNGDIAWFFANQMIGECKRQAIGCPRSGHPQMAVSPEWSALQCGL